MNKEPAYPTGLIGKIKFTSYGGHTEHVSEYESKFTGMTIRDYFAGQVVGHIYKDFWDAVRADKGAFDADWPMGLAMEAYRMADAMLKARDAQ